MKQADEIKALREEVAQLRDQVKALIDLNIELVRQQPVQIVPYAPYTPPAPPVTPWGPGITWYCSDTTRAYGQGPEFKPGAPVPGTSTVLVSPDGSWGPLTGEPTP